MKIAIVSDTHDNLPNFKKAVDWIKEQGIEIIIHCGDVACPETLDSILANFSGQFFISLGNADVGHSWEKYLPAGRQVLSVVVAHFKETGKVKIDGKNIGFCHFPGIAKGLAKSGEPPTTLPSGKVVGGKYDLVFYGHTHKPWKEKIGDCRLVNPGNLAGSFFKPTFAVFDTETNNLELKILQQL